MTSKTNILVIVSEDHSQHLGCYGAPDVQTPHLDALAARGVRFANHHTTQAVCSPGRASILTGLYPHQNGQIGLATQNYSMYRPHENLMSILKRQGYRTGVFGKLHVLPEAAFPIDERWGDAERFAFKCRDNHLANAQVERFIREGDGPFFAYIAYPDSHLPLLRQSAGKPEHPLEGKDVGPMPAIGIDSPRYREVIADYYNCMNRLDDGVGDLLARLKASGKADDTLVVFTTDHGQHLPRGKYHIYEQSLRLPWIMHHPTLLPAGKVVEQLTSHVDILPTVLDLLDIDDLPPNLLGASAVKLARGESDSWRDYAVGQWHAGSATGLFPQRSMRVGNYKYIVSYFAGETNPNAEYYLEASTWGNVVIEPQEIESAPQHVRDAYAMSLNPPREQLYDLEADPHEWHNLADDPEHAAALAQMRNRLESWQRDARDYIADPDVLAQLRQDHETIVAKHFTTKLGGRRSGEYTFDYDQYLQPR